MGLVWSLIAIGVFLLAAAVIVFIGFLLVRRMTRDIVAPLESLQQASRRIASGDYDTPVASCSTDELGETAAVFEEMRRQLQAGRKMRDAYEKNRQELFAGIAHDLATPLTKIQGYTGGILDGIAATPEKQKKYLELVYHTSQSMEQMVHELFLLSKFDLGKVDFQWENASLAPFCNSTWTCRRRPFRRRAFLCALRTGCQANRPSCWTASSSSGYSTTS